MNAFNDSNWHERNADNSSSNFASNCDELQRLAVSLKCYQFACSNAGSAKQGSGTSFEPCFARDDGLQKLLAKQGANETKVCRRFACCLKVVIQSNH